MLLDVKSVDKKFNGVYALKGLDFSLGEGETMASSVRTEPENPRSSKSSAVSIREMSETSSGTEKIFRR